MRLRNTAKFTTHLGRHTLRPGAEVDVPDADGVRFLALLGHVVRVDEPAPAKVAAPAAVDAEDTAEIEKPKRKRRAKKKTKRTAGE